MDDDASWLGDRPSKNDGSDGAVRVLPSMADLMAGAGDVAVKKGRRLEEARLL